MGLSSLQECSKSLWPAGKEPRRITQCRRVKKVRSHPTSTAVVAPIVSSAVVASVISLGRTQQNAHDTSQDFWLGAARPGLALGIAAILLCLVALRWPHRRDQTIARIVVAVVIGVFALLIAVWVHPSGELGDLATWVTAAGTVVTALGIVLAWRSYKTQQDHIRDDQARHVRQVHFHFRAGPTVNGHQLWETIVRNDSGHKVYDLQLRCFRTKNDDGDIVAMTSIDRKMLEDNGLVVGAIAGTPELDPESEFTMWWTKANSDAEVPKHNHQFTVRDAEGRHWLITDHYEPERIRRPSRTADQQLKSAGWST